jgi:hypothetical protein
MDILRAHMHSEGASGIYPFDQGRDGVNTSTYASYRQILINTNSIRDLFQRTDKWNTLPFVTPPKRSQKR